MQFFFASFLTHKIYIMGFVLIFLAIVAFFVYLWFKNRYTVKNPWQHFFDGFAFTPEEFYAQVKAGIKERNVPDLTIDTERFIQSHIMSDRREYLKIRRNEFVFYVGAAPFGSGTFVSEWLCVWRLRIWNRIPIVSKLMGKDRDDKTFYQMDTEAMYRSFIHTAVVEALDKLSSAKGARGLTESEKQLSLK